jgi:hypothetical protein
VTGETYAWLARIHGLLAVLGLASLLHPVVLLRTRANLVPHARTTAELGAGLLLAAFAIGWWTYPAYRSQVKRPLWVVHPDAVLRFETKEHLAAMAVALAVGGALVLRVAGRQPVGREAAWILLLCGWTLGVVTALLGVYVAGSAHPGW